MCPEGPSESLSPAAKKTINGGLSEQFQVLKFRHTMLKKAQGKSLELIWFVVFYTYSITSYGKIVHGMIAGYYAKAGCTISACTNHCSQCTDGPRCMICAAGHHLKEGAWASCQIAGAPAWGMPGTFSPSPQVSDLDMHHGTCVTHVPWCMPGSLTIGFLWKRRRGKTFPAFPAHA